MSQDRTGEILVKINELIDLVKKNQVQEFHYHYHYPATVGSWTTNIPTSPTTFPYWNHYTMNSGTSTISGGGSGGNGPTA